MRKRAWYDIPDGYGYFDEGSYEKIFGDYSVCIYNDDIYDETENGEWSYGVYSADGDKEYKTSPERRYNSAQEAASEAEWYLRQVLRYKDAMRKRSYQAVPYDELEKFIKDLYDQYQTEYSMASSYGHNEETLETAYLKGARDMAETIVRYMSWGF